MHLIAFCCGTLPSQEELCGEDPLPLPIFLFSGFIQTAGLACLWDLSCASCIVLLLWDIRRLWRYMKILDDIGRCSWRKKSFFMRIECLCPAPNRHSLPMSTQNMRSCKISFCIHKCMTLCGILGKTSGLNIQGIILAQCIPLRNQRDIACRARLSQC